VAVSQARLEERRSDMKETQAESTIAIFLFFYFWRDNSGGKMPTEQAGHFHKQGVGWPDRLGFLGTKSIAASWPPFKIRVWRCPSWFAICFYWNAAAIIYKRHERKKVSSHCCVVIKFCSLVGFICRYRHLLTLIWFTLVRGRPKDNAGGSLPVLVTLTKTSSYSDLSAMSRSEQSSDQASATLQKILQQVSNMEEDMTAAETESGEDGGDKLKSFQEKMNKRKQDLMDLAAELLDIKKRKLTITVERKVTRVEDLPADNILALDKQTSLINYLRDVVFTGVKYVTKETLEGGNIMKKITDNLQITDELQKNRYQRHLELALKKKIGQFRNNSIKNIKWKYRKQQGKGAGK